MGFLIDDGTLRKYIDDNNDTDIIVPDGVNAIGNMAFDCCRKLENITIPERVTSIGDGAFVCCRKLKNITIPNGVTSIGRKAFGYCDSLTSIVIPKSVMKISDAMLDGCSELESITMPEGVTSIGDGAFMSCGKLENITIPEGVTSIGVDAFCRCSSLTSITMPNGVTSIENGTFCNCKRLASIEIPEGVTNIGNSAFSGCESLTSITIPNSVTSIGREVFSGCSSLTSIEIPEGVTSIGDRAFRGCSRLTSITMPDGVTSIGEAAFSGCESLTSIMIPDRVTSISGGTFEGCSELESVIIPEGVTSIGDGAFRWCSRLTSITIPDSVTSIGEAAFSGCHRLTSIIIPNSVTSIGAYAFSGCSSLTSIEIPERVTSISWGTFEGCSSLERVEIPEGVTSIGDRAFRGCNRLKSITIPNSVKSLGECVFSDYSILTDVIGRLSQWMGAQELLDAVIHDEKTWKKINLDQKAEMFIKKQCDMLMAAYCSAEQEEGAEFCKAVVDGIPEKATSKQYIAVSKLLCHFMQELSPELVVGAYEKMKASKKATSAVEYLEANREFLKKVSEYNGTSTEETELDHKVDAILARKQVPYSELEVLIKSYYSLTRDDLPHLLLKDGTEANPSILQTLLIAHETMGKHYTWSKVNIPIPENNNPGVFGDVEPLIEEINGESLQDALRYLIDNYISLDLIAPGKKNYLMLPICRYAEDDTYAYLAKKIPSWSKDIHTNSCVDILLKASLYSETQSALLLEERFHKLADYAKLRGMEEEEIRNEYLFDLGLDEHGKKAYDLGNHTVYAVLQNDLSYAIEIPEIGKISKAIPKKDADPKKYKEASDDFARIKKDTRKVASSAKEILFQRFLSGSGQKPDRWEKVYIRNPVFRMVSNNIVWQQGKSTFIISSMGLADCAGNKYSMTGEDVCVAHPMEIDESDLENWREFFVRNGLKQPFEQIWERVINLDTLETDRYRNIWISRKYFLGSYKHGVHISSVPQSNEIREGTYEGVKIYVRDESLDIAAEESGDYSKIMMESITVKKKTREANHLVCLLDKWTVWEKIRQDDVTIISMLPAYNGAQILKFLKVAIEAGATNVTATLAEYKNSHYPELDAYEDLTLE